MSPAPKDYVDVAERIRQFKAQYPDGSLQHWVEPKMVSAGEKAFIMYAAAAFRTPDDERPGIGWAWEPVPGPTPFTKDSELMNAETSAWGRAIVALGFDTKHVASSEEVRNRQEFVPPPMHDHPKARPSEGPPSAAERPASKGTLKYLAETVEALQKGFPSPDPDHKYADDVRRDVQQLGKERAAELSEEQVQGLVLKYEKQLIDAKAQEALPFG